MFGTSSYGWLCEVDMMILCCYGVQLCLKPTPIHKWNLPGIPPGFEVAVKREDLTGCLFSGNKVVKAIRLFN